MYPVPVEPEGIISMSLPAQVVTDGPNGDDATNANEAMRDNMSLRTSLENLMKINKIKMQDHFIQMLNEITKAGLPGKDLLLDMITTASTGTDPAPEGDPNRMLTQEDIIVIANRLTAAKTAAQNDEDDLAANNDDFEELFAGGENALQQAKKVQVANKPLPAVVPVNLPSAAIHGPTLAPVRRAELPDIVQETGAGANEAHAGDPREEARKVVEAEKVKVLRHQELLMERREREEIRYDPELDYSFLQICRQGTIN